MKHIKISAGLAYVSYARIVDLALEAERQDVIIFILMRIDMHDLKNM